MNRKIFSFLLLTIFILITVFFFVEYFSPDHQVKRENKMQKVTSKDGTVISFMRSGKGPPLLLVHGTTADYTRWSPILPYFENHFTVYAMDRRGRGESGDSPVYSLFKEAEDIAAVVESINEPVCILGHSHGGLASLEAAILTDNIKKMILYEPPVPQGTPFYPPGVPEKMQILIDSNDNEAALKIFFNEVVKMPDYEFEKYSKLPVYKRRIELVPTIPRELTINRHYSFERIKFKNLDIPIMLLLGGDSPDLFKKAILTLDGALPNSKIVVLPGQQHIAMDTAPELFVKEVLKFLID